MATYFQIFDKRVIVISIFLLCFAITSSTNTLTLGVLILLLLILNLGRLKIIFKRLVFINIFLIFFWLTLPFTLPDGHKLATLYTFRTNSVALLLEAFLIPMGLSGFSYTLQSLKVPDKIVSVIFFTSAYIYYFQNDLNKRIFALKLRKSSNHFIYLVNGYAGVISSCIANSFHVAEKVGLAMQCRGFHGKLPYFDTPVIKIRDYWAGLAATGCFIYIVLM